MNLGYVSIHALVVLVRLRYVQSTRVKSKENFSKVLTTSANSCASVRGGIGTKTRTNELSFTGIYDLSFEPQTCSVSKGQAFSGVRVEHLRSLAESKIVVDAGRKKSEDPAIVFKRDLDPGSILGVGVGNGKEGQPQSLNFAVLGRLKFSLRGDASKEYTFENFRVGQSSQWMSWKAKSVMMNNWWLASDKCKFYSNPLGLRCLSTCGTLVCIELEKGPNKFHATECSYTKSNAAPALMDLLKESPTCGRDEGVCVQKFESNGQQLDTHEMLDLHPANNSLFGFIWNQVVQKDDQLMQEILQGGHVVLENDALPSKDGEEGKTVYEFLGTLADAFERTSSHASDVTQFGVPQGRIMSHLLFGRLGGKTWFQFENSPWSLFTDPLGSLHHAVDWVQYQTTGKNQGPLGASVYTDSNPMRVEKIRPLAEACPAMCAALGQGAETTTTIAQTDGGAMKVSQKDQREGDLFMWIVRVGSAAIILALAVVLYCQYRRNRRTERSSSTFSIVD